MRRGFKAWSEKQAVYWRRKLNLPAHAYLPARDLADYHSIDVIGPADIPGIAQKDVDRLLIRDPRGWSAVTVSVDLCTIIISNPRHSLPRQESNIMHELAHIICGHNPIRFKQVPWFPFPFREYQKEDEEEAEWLGASLQIPRDGLMWALNRGMQQAQIEEYFKASRRMVQFRRNKTGVDIQRRSRYSRS